MAANLICSDALNIRFRELLFLTQWRPRNPRRKLIYCRGWHQSHLRSATTPWAPATSQTQCCVLRVQRWAGHEFPPLRTLPPRVRDEHNPVPSFSWGLTTVGHGHPQPAACYVQSTNTTNAHPFKRYLRLFSCYYSRVHGLWLQSLKYLLSGPLQKKFSQSC